LSTLPTRSAAFQVLGFNIHGLVDEAFQPPLRGVLRVCILAPATRYAQLMANTRRRSRAGETANTQRQQCSASHATSIAEEDTAVLEELSPVTVADSAEDASPHIDSPISRSTKGFCRNCGSNIGEYYNSWHKVTGSYYVPALLGSYKSLLRCSGKQKAASRGTAIEGW
jgi:RNA polymerase-binding transcription factor DksA